MNLLTGLLGKTNFTKNFDVRATFCNLGIISDIPLGLGAGTLNTSIV